MCRLSAGVWREIVPTTKEDARTGTRMACANRADLTRARSGTTDKETSVALEGVGAQWELPGACRGAMEIAALQLRTTCRRGRAGGRALRGRLLGRAGHVAQLFTRLEPDREAGRDLHFLGGAFRVSADAAFSAFHEEHAEAAQLDALAARQRLAQRVDDRLDGLRRLLAPHAGRSRDRVDDVFLDHLGESLPVLGHLEEVRAAHDRDSRCRGHNRRIVGSKRVRG